MWIFSLDCLSFTSKNHFHPIWKFQTHSCFKHDPFPWEYSKLYFSYFSFRLCRTKNVFTISSQSTDFSQSPRAILSSISLRFEDVNCLSMRFEGKTIVKITTYISRTFPVDVAFLPDEIAREREKERRINLVNDRQTDVCKWTGNVRGNILWKRVFLSLALHRSHWSARWKVSSRFRNEFLRSCDT